MRARHLLYGVCGVLLGAAGALSHGWYGPAPAKIDVGSLKAKKIGKSAVGGGKAVEGYVASYGTFRLGGGVFDGSVIVPTAKAGAGAFRQFPLVYVNEYLDPGTGTDGSLYYASLDDNTQRFYLFGNKNMACGDPVERRTVIAFDGNGNPLHQVNASYARSSAAKEKEKEKGKGKDKKKKKDDDD